MMKRICAFAVVAAMGLTAAACTSNEKRYAKWGGGGAAAGALAGGLIGGGAKGALIGAAVGGGAGSLIAHEKNKNANRRSFCTYRDSEGHTYRAVCH